MLLYKQFSAEMKPGVTSDSSGLHREQIFRIYVCTLAFCRQFGKKQTNKQTNSRGILASYPMTNFSNQKLPFPLSPMYPKENKNTFGISANDVLSLHKHLLSTCSVTSKWQWHPTPVFLQGKSHGWRSLVGCSPWGC